MGVPLVWSNLGDVSNKSVMPGKIFFPGPKQGEAVEWREGDGGWGWGLVTVSVRYLLIS